MAGTTPVGTACPMLSWFIECDEATLCIPCGNPVCAATGTVPCDTAPSRLGCLLGPSKGLWVTDLCSGWFWKQIGKN